MKIPSLDNYCTYIFYKHKYIILFLIKTVSDFSPFKWLMIFQSEVACVKISSKKLFFSLFWYNLLVNILKFNFGKLIKKLELPYIYE